MEYIKRYQSPIGEITMASDGESLIGLWFEDDKYYADILKEPVEQDLPVFDQTIAWLNLYFDGIVPNFCPPIKMQGTPFQKMIWTIIQHIPYGETITYGDIAKAIAKYGNKKEMSAQAVGGAIGHNHIALIIPSHRVIGSKGNLKGYASGVEKKKKLLLFEKASVINSSMRIDTRLA